MMVLDRASVTVNKTLESNCKLVTMDFINPADMFLQFRTVFRSFCTFSFLAVDELHVDFLLSWDSRSTTFVK